MKKAEMEAETAAYQEAIRLAQAAERNGMYRQVIDAAISAWPYVDGMVLHERKYQGNEVARIAAVDLVLRYAPLLLDLRPLVELERMLAGYKRVLRDSFAVLTEKLTQARERIRENHRLWTYLEQNPDAPQDGVREALGGDQDRWRSVAEAWERMGMLTRTPAGRSYRLSLATRMGGIARGKCPSCGHVDHAPKAMLLEAISCPGCRAMSTFVLLSTQDTPES